MNSQSRGSAKAERGSATFCSKPTPNMPSRDNSKSAKADGAKAIALLKPTPSLPSRPPIKNPAQAGGGRAPRSLKTIAATRDRQPIPAQAGADQASTRTATTACPPDRQLPARKRGKADAKTMPKPNAETHPPSSSNPGESRARPGHFGVEIQMTGAGAQPLAGNGGGDDDAHNRADIQLQPSPIIAEIIQLWRMRQRWHRAEKALILQGKAICRAWTGGDKETANAIFDDLRAGKAASDPHIEIAVAPFLLAIENFEPQRIAIEKRLRKLAAALPIFPFVKSISGFGDLNLAGLVGEAGDIGTYRNPSCLWKRMGLAVINGERQRKKTNAEEAIAHGYNPSRRAVAYLIGDTMLKKQVASVKDGDGKKTGSAAAGPYGEIYLARKSHEAARTDDNAAKTPKHVHNRAARYMVKRVLRDLFAAWRKLEVTR